MNVRSKPETPEVAAKRLTKKLQKQGYSVHLLHPYKDVDGNVVFYRIRLRHPDGRKQIRPMHLNGSKFELCQPLKGERGGLIYQLPDIIASPDSVVWIVEGETCADALTKLGMVATTSGGATSAAQADWSPLEGRKCVIWPDNDAGGRKYARDVAARLRSLQCVVETVDVGGLELPEKGDCIDWLAEHEQADAAEVSALPRLQEAAISGSDVLDAVHAYLGRFVAYPCPHSHVAHALWIAHTHLMDVWETTPRIAFLSTEPGSGKTRALEVTRALVPRAVHSMNATPAFLFRSMASEDGLPTILYDEIDTLFGPLARGNEEVRALINGGHHRGAMVGRCICRGEDIVPEQIPSFCAVAMAGLGYLPDSIRTRSILIQMRKRAPHEFVESFRHRQEADQGAQLGERLAEWAAGIEHNMQGRFPELPKEISDRDADIWEPLITVADAAGGTWPDRARVAAVALVAATGERVPSLGTLLLSDIHRVFGDAEALPTTTILGRLNNLDESPWGDLQGKPLDSRGLARRLKPYEVSPTSIRVEGRTPKGYKRSDFVDAWSRYLPPESATSATAATIDPEASQ